MCFFNLSPLLDVREDKKEELFDQIKKSYAYSNISRENFEWIITFLERGGKSLSAYPDYHKLKNVDGVHLMNDKKLIAQHRMNIGTISSNTMIQLKYLSGKRIGSVDEEFINRLKIGESFMFGGKAYKLVILEDNAALLRLSKKRAEKTARWTGAKLPLSDSLSNEIKITFAFPEKCKKFPEYPFFEETLQLQAHNSYMPKGNELLIETIKKKEGYHLFFYPFESRSVHETLTSLIATRLLKFQKNSFTTAFNDYGCELLSVSPIENLEIIFPKLFSENNIEEDLQEALNMGELAKKTFRDVARIAGLVHQGYPGRRKAIKSIQASTSLLFDVFKNYDPENLLLEQAKREVVQNGINLYKLKETLKRIQNLKFIFVNPKKLSPLSLPLYLEYESNSMSAESIEEIMLKIQKSWKA
jgi:ATP-dependent Lhr-like helicase